MLKSSLVLMALMALVGCYSNRSKHPAADQIELSWGVRENSPEGDLCRSELALTNKGDLPLSNQGWMLYFSFANIIVSKSVPASIRIAHINGDFYSLSPTAEFVPLRPGESRKIPIEARSPVTNESGAPSGFYFVFGQQGRESSPQIVRNVRIEPFYTWEQTRRAQADQVKVPTPESRFKANQELTLLPASEVQKIVPTPIVLKDGRGAISLNPSFRIHYARGLTEEARYLAATLEALFGSKVTLAEANESGPGVVRLSAGSLVVGGKMRQPGGEAYRLLVDSEKGVEIAGTDPAGVFYGIQSLRALIPPEALRGIQKEVLLGEVSVEDAPRFTYRGLHLDVARNFHSKETVKKLLDLMAFYKLNRFHFHLTDDEGWRLAIKNLPELAEVGGRRGHTLDEADRLVPSLGSGPDADPAKSCGSGYYTRQDFVEILQYAHQRHIEVIPEMDVPGHARAAIRAMDARYSRLLSQGKKEQALECLLRDPEDRSEYRSVQGWNDNVINVCQESTYHFLKMVIDEIIEMYREAKVPLRSIHTGGDEVPHGVWEKSPACKALLDSGVVQAQRARELSRHFVHRFSSILSERNLKTAGWEEIVLTEERTNGRQRKVPDGTLLGRDLRAYVWNSVWGFGGEENAYNLANAGYSVVLCNASNLYFDLAYDKDPKEPGLHWAGFVDTRKVWEFTPLDVFQAAKEDLMGRPLDATAFTRRVRLTEKGRENILGIQGQLWGENAKSPELLEYLAFPKLLALAERAWAEQGWAEVPGPAERNREREATWNRFANALGQRELPRLDYLRGGVAYRIPPPGAIIQEGQIRANTPFPSLTIRYTTDGSEPTVDSQLYIGPVPATGVVKLRGFNTRERGSRTSELR